jgi:hypothetical protein
MIESITGFPNAPLVVDTILLASIVQADNLTDLNIIQFFFHTKNKLKRGQDII